MSVKIAFYHGPPSTFMGWVAHVAIAARSLSTVTHVELVVDGVCYTSSGQDGGVRRKIIDLNDGRWEVFDLYDKDGILRNRILEFYEETQDIKYGWKDILTYALPFVPPDDNRYICSEWCVEALGWSHIATYKIKPSDLYNYVKKIYVAEN